MSARTAQRGFTLLEMLVVLILIGIIMSLAVLSFSGTGARDRLEEEAQRMIQLIALAREEAILQVQDLAVEVEPTGYRFARLRHTDAEDTQTPAERLAAAAPAQGSEGDLLADSAPQWQRIEDDPLLRPRELQEGQEIVLDPSLEALPGVEEDEVPRIYLSPSGEISPFELSLRDGDYEVRVLGSPDGRLRLDDEEEG